MTPNEKKIFSDICKYCEMVNAQLADLLHREVVLKAVILSDSKLEQEYSAVLERTPQTGLPAVLIKQLRSIRQAVESLPTTPLPKQRKKP